MRLSGRIILITGGAKRIGKEIAISLANAGAHVVITYLSSKQEASETVKEIKRFGVPSLAIRADVRSAKDVRRAVKQVLRQFGRIDVLVNNAANFLRVPFEKLTEKDFDLAIDTNLKGPYLFSVEVGKVMLRQKQGHIINIADIAGIRPYRDYLPYGVSKGGLIALTKALAKSLAPHVRVNAVLPGTVLFPEDYGDEMREKIIRKIPLGRPGSPQDVVSAVRFLIEGSDFITGVCLPVDGGRLVA